MQRLFWSCVCFVCFVSIEPATVFSTPTCPGNPNPGLPPDDFPVKLWCPSPNFDSRGNSKIQYIIIHTIQGDLQNGGIKTFLTPYNPTTKQGGLSAHYLVDKNGDVVQMVALNKAAQHASSYNPKSVGIEIAGCSLNPGWRFDPKKGCDFPPRVNTPYNSGEIYLTEEMYQSVARLVLYIANKFGIPLDRNHIKGHNEISSEKHDPCPQDAKRYPCGRSNDRWDWDYFMALVRGEPPIIESTKIFLTKGWNQLFSTLDRRIQPSEIAGCKISPKVYWQDSQQNWKVSDPGEIYQTYLNWIYVSENCTGTIIAKALLQSFVFSRSGWAPISSTRSWDEIKGDCKLTDGPFYYTDPQFNSKQWVKISTTTPMDPLKAYWVKVARACQTEGATGGTLDAIIEPIIDDTIPPPIEPVTPVNNFLICSAGEDNLIDDLEIIEILDAWQKQKDFRGCGVPTDDDYMKALASWIKRQPVNEDDVSPDLNFIVLSHYITDIIPDYYNPNQARTEFDANKVQETGLDVYVVVKFNGKLQGHNLEWQFFNPQGVWEETVWFDAPDNYTNNFAVAQHFINPAQKEILGRWTIKFFIDGKFQFEDSFIISQTSGIPEVTFVQIPEFITMNTPTGWQLGFFDPDANVVKVRFEQFVSGNWQGAGEFDPGVRGQTQGKISVTTTCHKAGLVRARVSLIDETGNRSEFKEYSFSCVGDEGSGITTIILRANYKSECPVCVGDHCYDFPSVKCVRFEWQYESNDVTLFEIKSMYSDRSGYSEIINRVNPVIREYSELLTEDKKVCVQVRAQTSRGFTDWSNKVCATVSAITPSSRWKPELSNKIVIAKAQIFSLTGQLVYDIDFGDPQKLVWDLRDYRNLPIANGVYLVVITTTDIYGLTRREIKKIVVLR